MITIGFHFYRSLWTVFHIIDRQLDLGLMGNQRILEEGNAAQEDGIAGALKKRIIALNTPLYAK